MARHAHQDWGLNVAYTYNDIQCALLMDIREILNKIAANTSPLICYNARRIPTLLTKIASNTDQFKCHHHPRYKAILPPRTDCKDCRRMFRRRHA